MYFCVLRYRFYMNVPSHSYSNFSATRIHMAPLCAPSRIISRIRIISLSRRRESERNSGKFRSFKLQVSLEAEETMRTEKGINHRTESCDLTEFYVLYSSIVKSHFQLRAPIEMKGEVGGGGNLSALFCPENKRVVRSSCATIAARPLPILDWIR